MDTNSNTSEKKKFIGIIISSVVFIIVSILSIFIKNPLSLFFHAESIKVTTTLTPASVISPVGSTFDVTPILVSNKKPGYINLVISFDSKYISFVSADTSQDERYRILAPIIESPPKADQPRHNIHLVLVPKEHSLPNPLPTPIPNDVFRMPKLTFKVLDPTPNVIKLEEASNTSQIVFIDVQPATIIGSNLSVNLVSTPTNGTTIVPTATVSASLTPTSTTPTSMTSTPSPTLKTIPTLTPSSRPTPTTTLLTPTVRPTNIPTTTVTPIATPVSCINNYGLCSISGPSCCSGWRCIDGTCSNPQGPIQIELPLN
jgi:hypothetical protein